MTSAEPFNSFHTPFEIWDLRLNTLDTCSWHKNVLHTYTFFVDFVTSVRLQRRNTIEEIPIFNTLLSDNSQIVLDFQLDIFETNQPWTNRPDNELNALCMYCLPPGAPTLLFLNNGDVRVTITSIFRSSVDEILIPACSGAILISYFSSVVTIYGQHKTRILVLYTNNANYNWQVDKYNNVEL